MQMVVQKWGNSLGFRIPSLWAKDNNIKKGSKVEMIIEKEKIVILHYEIGRASCRERV